MKPLNRLAGIGDVNCNVGGVRSGGGLSARTSVGDLGLGSPRLGPSPESYRRASWQEPAPSVEPAKPRKNHGPGGGRPQR